MRLNEWRRAAGLRQSRQRAQLQSPGATPNPLAITMQELHPPLSRHDSYGRNAQKGSKECERLKACGKIKWRSKGGNCERHASPFRQGLEINQIDLLAIFRRCGLGAGHFHSIQQRKDVCAGPMPVGKLKYGKLTMEIIFDRAKRESRGCQGCFFFEGVVFLVRGRPVPPGFLGPRSSGPQRGHTRRLSGAR